MNATTPQVVYGRILWVIGPRTWERKLQQEVTVDGVTELRDVPVEVVLPPEGEGND